MEPETIKLLLNNITIWLQILCTALIIIFLLRYAQVIWSRKIDLKEREDADERNTKEQVNIHKRKLDLLDKQELAKRSEREYLIESKAVNPAQKRGPRL